MDGKYFQMLNSGDHKRPALVFVPDVKYNLIREIKKEYNYTGFAACEAGEEKKRFDVLLYRFFNVYGDTVKKYSCLIYFDFANSTITANNKTLKVIEDHGYTYKIQKTQIKAARGISGLYSFIVDAMNIESPFNSDLSSFLEKAFN